MDLKTYLVRERIKFKDFAKLLGCSVSALGASINGYYRPGRSFAKLIEIYTNGEVKAEDLLLLPTYKQYLDSIKTKQQKEN